LAFSTTGAFWTALDVRGTEADGLGESSTIRTLMTDEG